MRWGGRLTQPIVLVAVGILALLAVLIVRGGFQRPMAFIVWPVLVLGMVGGFLLFSARASQRKRPRRAEDAPPQDARTQPTASFSTATRKDQPP